MKIFTIQRLLPVLFLIGQFLFLSNFLFARDQVVFNIIEVPEYTPHDDSLFLCSSINDWRLRDEDFLFRKLPDGTFRLAIDLHKGQRFDYKINRGSWASVEGNDLGVYRADHSFSYVDSIYEFDMVVESWQDLHQTFYPATVIKVISIPDYTPKDAKIYLAGTFNAWNCADPDYVLEAMPDGTYQFEINSGMKEFEFKFTRGSWQSVEARWDGGVRSNRFVLVDRGNSNVLVTTIKGWEDLSKGQLLWKVIFMVLIVQGVVVGVFLWSNIDFRLVIVPVFSAVIAFSVLFLYCNNLLSQYFIKAMFLPGCIFGLQVPLVFYALKRRAFRHLLRFDWGMVVVGIPFFIYLFILFIPKEELWFLANNNVTTLWVLLTYMYSFGVIYFFLYQLSCLLTCSQIECSVLVVKFLKVYRFFVVLSFVLLLGSFVGLFLPVDSKLVVSLFERFVWLGVGLLLIYGQVLVLQYASGVIEVKQDCEETNLLLDTSWEHLKLKLIELIEQKQLYLNSRLTLSDLATALGTNTNYVSRVLNEGFNASFNDYINACRVRFFIQEVEALQGDSDTFLHLAFKSGFNSKSSFNRAFKKSTGLTPSAYFRKQDVEGV